MDKTIKGVAGNPIISKPQGAFLNAKPAGEQDSGR
jgi:hypothetical protein